MLNLISRWIGTRGGKSAIFARHLRGESFIELMESKISFKWVFLVVSLAIITSTLIIVFIQSLHPLNQPYINSAVPIGADTLETVIKTKPIVSVVGLPARLKIPKINVDATIESTGLTPQGAMDVPKDANNAAWFNLGPRPGEKGNAVIDGHLDWIHGASAVFDNLYKLRPGDKISVEDDKGVTTTFVVREFRIYDQNQDASDVFGTGNGQSHLNLITCEGLWNKTEKGYPNRLIVFSDKE